MIRWLPLLVLLAACPPPPAVVPPPVQPAPPPVVVVPPPPPPAPKPLEPSVPTLRLPRNFMPTAYALRFAIDPKLPTFTGAVAITGTISEKSAVIWLHARGLDVQHATATIGSTTAALAVTPHAPDLLELRADPPLEPGTYRVDIDYGGRYDDVNTAGLFKELAGGTPYIFTQFEALYARRAFPCIDEPDVKVPWTLALDIPSKLTAVGNAPELHTTPLDADHKRVEFAPTKPLPSYLVAFGVGPFDIVDAGLTKSGTPVRVITLKGRAGDAAYAAKVTPRVIDLLEEWFGARYPYDKLDLLTIPTTVGFGAMENAGLVTYVENVILFDPQHASWDSRHRWVLYAAHELSHQWFGDYVTTAWWDDIWLNEGFADWLETKIAARLEPAWHDELASLAMRVEALDADSLTTARRIRQPIETPDDILGAFDSITYQKGASVLNMFEAYVGEAAFQKGVRDYMAARAYGNATSADFIAAISAAAGKDLAPAFSSFLDQSGAPELEAKVSCGRGAPRVELAQRRYVPAGSAAAPAGKPWILPVCVVYERGGKRAEACTLLDQPNADVALDTKTCPRWVWPNAGGRGYYHTRLAAPQVVALRDEAWPQLSWNERRTLLLDVAETARYRPHGRKDVRSKMPNMRLPLPLAISLVPKMLSGGDRFTVADALALPLAIAPLVADDQRAKYEGWMRALFGPGETALGVQPKDGDDIDAEALRRQMYEAVAGAGRDPELGKAAVTAFDHWRDLPSAMRGSMLSVAVDASTEVFARALTQIYSEPDIARRAELYHALAAAHDPKQHAQALQLVLDRKLDIRESMFVLFVWSGEASRKLTESFVKEHERDLMTRLPHDMVSGSVSALAEIFTSACDPARREDIAGYLAEHFGALPGGRDAVKQAVETMDQCIATRATLEPQVRAWLGGWKAPKPPGKPKKK